MLCAGVDASVGVDPIPAPSMPSIITIALNRRSGVA
jgi:hypothetical protein